MSSDHCCMWFMCWFVMAPARGSSTLEIAQVEGRHHVKSQLEKKGVWKGKHKCTMNAHEGSVHQPGRAPARKCE